MAGVDIDSDAVNKAIEKELLSIAEGIADVASQRYAQRELRPGGKGAPHAEVRDGVVVVTTDWSFAHIDEWGGPDVRSVPTAAMRSAAAEAGRFIPAAKS